MRHRGQQVRRLVVAVAILAPLLLGVSGSAQAMFRCRYDQVARKDCCCPKSNEPAAPSFTRSCCCDIEVIEAASPAGPATQVERLDLGKLHDAPRHAALEVPGPVVAPVIRQWRFLAAHPPPAGPRLILLKSSFLI